MKRLLILSIFFLFKIWCVNAQDAYHTWLKAKLQNDYNILPSPEWVLSENESTTINQAINYGGTISIENVSGQPFSLATKVNVLQGANPWDAGHLFKNQRSVTIGDKCLIAVWLKSNDDKGQVFLLAENASTYSKEVIVQLKVVDEWQLYLLPFESKENYGLGSLQLGIEMAFRDQIIEIGGMACLNYGKNLIFSTLPVRLNNGDYDGIAEDAPWRTQAQIDIDLYRKANLKVKINSSPNDITDYDVKIEMLQHDFKFGTAVVSNLFNGGSNNNLIYEEKLLNLDGKGHGFNELVFENDLKWPGWENHWLSSQEEILSDIAWILDKGITVRGHNLVWPGWSYSPSDINPSQPYNYIIKRNKDHIKSILSNNNIGNLCSDWDVINEITTNNDYANHFKGNPGYTTGREFYTEIFKLTDSLVPDAKLYLNDFIALEQGDLPTNGISQWQAYIDEMLAAGAPIEGLGFQGHFSTSPTGIPRVKEILDNFWNKYGMETKITEYDINNLTSQTIQEKYMRDILTICFAHPSMKGFIMWGFWDGAHWLGYSPIFNSDWSLKPSGNAFIDMVFNKWWTNEQKTMKANIENTFRIFKGKHKITVTDPSGNTLTSIIDLDSNDEIEFFPPIVKTQDEDQADIEIYPNPAVDKLYLRNHKGLAHFQILNLNSNLLISNKISSDHIDISSLSDGMYLLKINNKGRSIVKRFVVNR